MPGVQASPVHPSDIDDPSAPPPNQQYCLIGSDGVFVLPSKDYRLEDRKRIEHRYADRVKAAHDSVFQTRSGYADELNSKLRAAGNERAHALGAIYTRRTVSQDESLPVRVEADAPYQVVELDYKRNRTVSPPVRVVVHPPWPGYVASRRLYGWDYEVPYAPTEFHSRYVEWHRHHLTDGGPAFYGLEGRNGPVHVDNIVGSRSSGYAYRRMKGGPVISWYPEDVVPGAPTTVYGRPAPATTRPQGYTHSAPNPPPATGYTHGGVASPTPATGYTHSAHSTPKSNGYTHSRDRQKSNPNGNPE